MRYINEDSQIKACNTNRGSDMTRMSLRNLVLLMPALALVSAAAHASQQGGQTKERKEVGVFMPFWWVFCDKIDEALSECYAKVSEQLEDPAPAGKK